MFTKRSMEKSVTDSLVKKPLSVCVSILISWAKIRQTLLRKKEKKIFFWKTFLCLSVQKVINNRYVLITNRIKLYTSIYNIGKGDILFHLLLSN